MFRNKVGKYLQILIRRGNQLESMRSCTRCLRCLKCSVSCPFFFMKMEISIRLMTRKPRLIRVKGFNRGK
jgi:Fe-S-cluster-containing hydrogenase component 2